VLGVLTLTFIIAFPCLIKKENNISDKKKYIPIAEKFLLISLCVFFVLNLN